eukprot:7132-Heterococcus_DN1.PRE.3
MRVNGCVLHWCLRLANATALPSLQALSCEQIDSAIVCSANIGNEAAWSANMTLCYWYKHNALANARPLEAGWIAAGAICSGATDLLSIPVNQPGAYIVRAAIVAQGADKINSNTLLSPLAATTVIFDGQQKLDSTNKADTTCSNAIPHQAPSLSALRYDPTQRPLVAVVSARYGSYDDWRDVGAKDSSGLLDYFMFTDSASAAIHRTEDTFPYHLNDPDVTIMAKNSVYNANLTAPQAAQIASKYYKALAWRVPVLRKYHYIVYHDASMNVNTTDLYDQVIELIKGKAFVHPAHPYHKTIMAEAHIAVETQPRYARESVDLQAVHYMRNTNRLVQRDTALEHAMSGQHAVCDVETQCAASQQTDSCITDFGAFGFMIIALLMTADVCSLGANRYVDCRIHTHTSTRLQYNGCHVSLLILEYMVHEFEFNS